MFLISATAVSVAVIIDMATQGRNDATADTAQSQTQLAGTPLPDFTPLSKVNELKVIDTKVGTGQEVKAGDSVNVDYTGAVAETGIIFQSSKDTGQPATLSLDQVIEGWKQGIPGMKVGGERRLIIPADLAYGSTPPQGSGIPADAPLVFDITLKSIN